MLTCDNVLSVVGCRRPLIKLGRFHWRSLSTHTHAEYTQATTRDDIMRKGITKTNYNKMKTKNIQEKAKTKCAQLERVIAAFEKGYNDYLK